MRKAAFALSFLLALLCGCAPPAPAEPESPPEASPATSKAEFLPALTPLVELSTPAETAEGRAQGNYELPKKMFYDPVTEDDFPALLAELPEANAAFYGLDWDKALIRWGDSVAEFDWPWLTPRQILPRLYCFDLDHDWEDELIVVCHPGTGTGVSIDDLHVLEKNLDGTLTDYALPREFFSEDMSEALSVRTLNGRTYSILGAELVDVTSLLPEDAAPENIEGFCTGDIINFAITPEPEFNWEHIRVRSAASLCGEGFSPTLSYAAEVDAVVLYQDGVFTLSQIHLS